VTSPHHFDVVVTPMFMNGAARTAVKMSESTETEIVNWLKIATLSKC